MHKHIFALRVKYAQSKTFAQKDIFAEGVTFEQNHFCTIVEKKNLQDCQKTWKPDWNYLEKPGILNKNH